MNELIDTLAPAIVWRHFAALTRIPRPSKQEESVRHHLLAWARDKGFAAETDAVGNLLIRKPASAGGDALPATALQAHLDMVCQANAGCSIDFARDPIPVRRTQDAEGDWLVGDGTTLGADNGIGVALALAALEDENLTHGPLEVLLTVDEEAGMGGANGLQPGWLQARRMINLDTECWGEFYLGCAGGADVSVEACFEQFALPVDHTTFELAVSGLRGGHSGCDIHLKRANANRVLALLLLTLSQQGIDLRVIALHGGNARNALPREAKAQIACPESQANAMQLALDRFLAMQRATWIGQEGENQLDIRLETLPPTTAPPSTLSTADTLRFANALHSAPYGVAAMSTDFPGVVETSNNLGIVRLDRGQFSANLMVRSLRDASTRSLAEDIANGFQQAGCTARIEGHYPGWTPDPSSPLLATAQQVFQQIFSTASTVQVIHAGLECGIIGAKYPGMDTISFGPTIRGAHAPGERVETASVERCWILLRALLAAR